MTDEPAVSTSQTPAWLTRTFVALVLLACACMLSQRMVDPDLWGHIQYGEDWLAEGALPRVASHTYAAPGYPWVNHENLSELALAFGHRVGGGLGLMIGKAALGVIMLLSMIVVATRRGVSTFFASVCMLAVTGALVEFWCARPQLASFLCMAGLLLVLEVAFRDWESERKVRFGPMLALLPIMVIWTNAHGGFVAGFCVAAAYIGLRGLHALWLSGKPALPLFAKLCGVIVACGLCTLLNPYGPGLLLWLLKSLGAPRPEITEWVSIPRSGPTIIPFSILTVLTLASLKWSTRRRDPAQFITIGLVAVQTFMHCRHIAFYGILFGFWIPPHLHSVWQRVLATVPNKPESEPIEGRAARLLGLQAAAVAVLLGGLITYQFSQFGVDREEYPVDAVQFMSDHGLQGRIVVTFNWAQYTLAALPDSTVGFDGRFRTCYPQSVVDMNFDLTIGDHPQIRHRGADSGPFDPTAVLEHGKPDFVLIDRKGDWPARETLAQHADWTLLYQDSLAQLWGRRIKFGDPGSAQYVATPNVSDREVSGIAAWPAFPDRSGRDAFVQSARRYVANQARTPRGAQTTFHLRNFARVAMAIRPPVVPVPRLP